MFAVCDIGDKSISLVAENNKTVSFSSSFTTKNSLLDVTLPDTSQGAYEVEVTLGTDTYPSKAYIGFYEKNEVRAC